jgi:phosphoesterase RecJ-like protein
MKRNDSVSQIVGVIQDCRRIAITSHLRPDGDSICTGLALYYMMKQMGKEASLINKDRTPFPFTNLPDINLITVGQIPAGKFDAVILLECANVGRSGHDHLDDYFKINIDHHYSNDYYADLNWVEPEAAAVACLAFKLGRELKIDFTPMISSHLYCAIVSDTGSFQFSNTQATALETCAQLIRYGADSMEVSELLFNNNAPQKIKLLGQVLSTLQMSDSGSIGMVTMFQDFLKPFAQKEIDTEDITTLVRSIRGLKMVLFFKQMDARTFRVSLRSKGDANSALVAEQFDGGGHKHAAGFTVHGSYEDLIVDVPDKVERILRGSLEKISSGVS